MSFQDPHGLEHSVEVDASSVYEAAALGLQAFRASELSSYVRPGKTTRLVVTIRRLEAQHEVRVSQLEDWLASGGRSPREQVLKGRLRKLLGLR